MSIVPFRRDEIEALVARLGGDEPIKRDLSANAAQTAWDRI